MAVEAIRSGNVVELDVREMQKAKEEPFHVIMDAVDTLQQDDQFILHAVINPIPLLNVMKGRGFANTVEQLEEDHWKITFTKEM
ncbi:DUF2249 domain-containing protein [Tepidibacillus sp. HK-1]|uniref:DUF2249 domain-containing protein n=1 Tax=Tepidibacillus sp. HK-1 TaxID=1883407 RepID=UPI000852ED5E|nr:DUF2249 domain-containing protein [Tepidibacillus sp. HK-1]GBF11176.1 hypothetical protein HK1_01199 [Tepidibacillus sp. HK-1]